MNKYQDALSRMFGNIDIQSVYFVTDKCDEDYDILSELIEKAHGEWIDNGTWMVDRQGKFYIPQACSVCGYKMYGSHTTKFCPNCGADMRVVFR